MYGKLFGQFLYDQGIISKSDLKKALLMQDTINQPLGILALEQGMLSPEQLREILDILPKSTKRFGQLAIDHGFLTSKQVNQLLAIQEQSHLFLGEMLIRQGSLSPETLQASLTRFHAANRDVASRVMEASRHVHMAIPLKLILAIFQSYMSRAICGTAKATEVLSCGHPIMSNGFVTAHFVRDMAPRASRLLFGFTMGKREALSLCYCLTDKSIHDQGRAVLVLQEYAETLGYLIDTELRKQGFPESMTHIHMHDDTEPPRHADLCIRMSTTIGPLVLFFKTLSQDQAQ
ncbi:hypothetical protein [Desulfoplanes formicivorans]|uniref:Chemotaxis protein CheX n=1 Tax=Desulfoplanes formicivorans TaxID=1592317 RepID=A0A194AGL9_9BACT|nr:hypothetical protein [Desulfoplanes formicivorans]GAU07924.1 hypothetical protein DPF_0623 [Desulfoplanes formicivorans]